MRRLTMACLGLVAGAAQASAAGVDMGRQLAQQWCTGCHVIGTGAHGQDAAPTLPPPLRRDGEDKEWLRAWLANPHPPMPNFNLSRIEIDDIVAYLASLPRQ